MAGSQAITLALSGAFVVRDVEGREIGGISRRGQGLLAYLSQCRDMRAERARLADLLWSDRGAEQSRASLRQELSALRRALPDGILEANRQYVWLDPGRVRVETGPAPPLEGFDLPSEGFEDWLRTFRARHPAADAKPHDRDYFERPAVLLFAFEALSDDAEDRMIAKGLSDDLRTTLCYWRWFPVIGPDAIGWRTATEAELRETARAVGATYAVTGSLGRLGARVRVSVALTEAATGRSVWSRGFDGTLDDIFAFQEEVSRAIVAQIEPQIARAEAARIERVRPADVAPWQLDAMADEVDRRSSEGYGTAEDNFEQVRLMEQAIAKSPDYAPAYARIGRIWFRAALLGWTDDAESAYARSIEASRRALQIDPDNSEAHAYLGLASIFGLREYDSGGFHGQEAVRLNPSSAIARHAAGCALEWIGRPDEALGHLYTIFRLNPDYKGRAASLGDITTCELFVGNREAAVEAARRIAAIAPDYARGLQRCVATFGYFGETAEAEAALARLRGLQPDFGEAYVRETYPYARPEDYERFAEGLRRAGAFEG